MINLEMVSMMMKFRTGYRERWWERRSIRKVLCGPAKTGEEAGPEQWRGRWKEVMSSVKVEPIGYVVGLWRTNFHRAPGRMSSSTRNRFRGRDQASCKFKLQTSEGVQATQDTSEGNLGFFGVGKNRV